MELQKIQMEWIKMDIIWAKILVDFFLCAVRKNNKIHKYTQQELPSPSDAGRAAGTFNDGIAAPL